MELETTVAAPLELNPEQRQAAENLEDNLLLLAGAGTGKTGTLAQRVAYLLEHNILPESILCLTFTNRACREMTGRVEKVVGERAKDVTVRTIHSFCTYVLRHAPESVLDIGRDFTVSDEEDTMEILRAIVLEVTGKEIEGLPVRILYNFAGLIKEHQLIHPSDNCRQAAEFLFTKEPKAVEKICITQKHDFDPKFYRFLGKYGASITELYNRRLRESNSLDFTDLLLETCRAMTSPEMQSMWSGRFQYVHVDEAQDMSFAEYKLIVQFCGQAKVMLCGDFNQTIYEWRGSDPEKLISAFQESYRPQTLEFHQNYRSRRQLLCLAQNFLYHGLGQGQGSALEPASFQCTDVVMEEFGATEQEVAWIYRQIGALGLTDLSKCAILTRNNAACKTVCDLLKLQRLEDSSSTPLRFMLADELRLFRRPEIKDLLAVIRVIFDPFDGESLRRIVTRLSTGVTASTLRALYRDCESARLTDFMDSRTLRTGDFFEPLLDALSKGNVVVYDVESTGTDVYGDDIIQIAAIRLAPDGTVSDKLERFLRPSKPVGDSQRVHGFSDAYLEEHGVSPAQALTEFLDFVQGCVIVGHNVHFDITITQQNLLRNGLKQPLDAPWYDTLDLARRFLPKLENHKLSTVAAALNASPPSHDAMDDILATAGVLMELCTRHLIPGTSARRACYQKYLSRFTPVRETLSVLRGEIPSKLTDLLVQADEAFQISQSARTPEIRANLVLLRDFAQDFIDVTQPPAVQATQLLELTALTTGELDRLGQSQNKIPVITVHQAKGCEFDYVFMPMLQDGVFPSFQALYAPDDREERRVFYVSITRAKLRIYFSWSQRNPSGRVFSPSRYLKLLGPNPNYQEPQTFMSQTEKGIDIDNL